MATLDPNDLPPAPGTPAFSEMLALHGSRDPKGPLPVPAIEQSDDEALAQRLAWRIVNGLLEVLVEETRIAELESRPVRRCPLTASWSWPSWAGRGQAGCRTQLRMPDRR